MPLSDDKADELAKAAREAARNAKSLVKVVDAQGEIIKGQAEDAADSKRRISELERKVSELERGRVDRALDLLHVSPSLQRAAGVVLVIAAIVGAVAAFPQVVPLLPLIGGISASK